MSWVQLFSIDLQDSYVQILVAYSFQPIRQVSYLSLGVPLRSALAIDNTYNYHVEPELAPMK